MTPKTIFALAALALLAFSNASHAQLEWRVSVKLFTDANGNLPGSGNIHTDQDARDRIALANTILDNTGRGYRYVITEIVHLSGTVTPAPAAGGSWYNLAVSSTTQDDIDTKAKANTTTFVYRTNAINFYVTGSTGGANGGYCAFPNEAQDAILVAQDSFTDVLVHEAGHFFGLSHTFDSGGSCSSGTPASGGNDGLADTALDYPCGTRDNVAMLNFGIAYPSLNAAQQAFVNTAWLNVMSYHSPGSLFTPDQMDLATANSNGSRINVCNGRTWFVANGGSDGAGGNAAAVPLATISSAVSHVSSVSDVVLLRGGSYAAPAGGVISKLCTLRPTRGNVTIHLP